MIARHIALVALLALHPVAVEAQPAGPDAIDVEESFAAGSAALRAGRFHEARDLLRAAHGSAHAVGTAFNLAVALRGTGEMLECAELFEALLDGTFGHVTTAATEQAHALRTECRSAVATLTITVGRGATVHVDGASIGELEGEVSRSLSLDPGSHVITAARDGFVTAQERVELERAEVGALRLDLVPVVVPALLVQVEPSPGPGAAGFNLAEEVWFWLSLVGVGLVAGGIALGVALTPPSVADPVGSPWSEPRVIP